jgi:signal transduction histidine kinase
VGTVQTLADKKGLALASVTAPDVGKMVSDRRRIEQILLNLLNNAIKFTDRGQVTLTTKLLRQPDLEAMVRFEVKDTGMGIRREHLGTLFQPFRQLDAGLARQHEGTGLGLAICQRLAALLGGQITVASEWAKGSDFTVTLPLERTEDP